VEVRAIAASSSDPSLARKLCATPSLDQRAVHGEVIVTHEALRLLVHRREKLLCHLAREQPVAVLENTACSHRVVHA